MKPGKKSRNERLTNSLPGAWGAYSQSYMRLALTLLEASYQHALGNKDQNVSPYPLTGIPLLFSALRALLIECNSGLYDMTLKEDKAIMERLSKDPNELKILYESYKVDGNLYEELSMMYEIRNELVHPALRPSGTQDMTPDYLRPLKELGVLQSTGDPSGDYPWMNQLESHRLFVYCFELLEKISHKVLPKHHTDPNDLFGHLLTYKAFHQFDLSCHNV